MKRNWTQEQLVERWTLFPDELAPVGAKTGHRRLGFAVMVRFFAGEGRFPRDRNEVPADVLRFVGEQVVESAGPETGPEGWMRYDWSGRTVKYHRSQIREFFGFREAAVRAPPWPPTPSPGPSRSGRRRPASTPPATPATP